VDRFVAGGHHVRVLDRRQEVYREPLPGVEYIYGDFATPARLAEALHGTEIVVHLVSTTIPKSSNDDPIFDIQSNLVGTVSCLQQCVAARVQKIIFLSSGGAVYGNPDHCPISEDSTTQPLCSYGIVKLAIEKYLGLYQSMSGLESVVLRVGNPYGPRQNPMGGQGLIAAILARIASGQPIEIWGDGLVVRDYFYVGDLANAIYSAAFADCRFQVYNVGSGVGLSILDIIGAVKRTLEVEVETRFLPARSFDVKKIYLDISRICEDLNWSPSISLGQGIQLTWNFVQPLRPTA